MERGKLGVHSCFDQIRCLMSTTFFIWHGHKLLGVTVGIQKNLLYTLYSSFNCCVKELMELTALTPDSCT